MKTLSVKQPWATLLTYGISDIENRSWAPNYTGKILIHASSAKVPGNFADKTLFEQMNHITNEQIFGNIPSFEDMEYSAILGYVTVTGDVSDSTSVWAHGAEHQWQITDAYLFDEPIRNVKGKLHLYDTSQIDENNLPPAHKVVRRVPKVEGDCLVLPFTEEWLQAAEEAACINLRATMEMMELVDKPLEEQGKTENDFKPLKTVRLETPERTVTYGIEEMAYVTWANDDGSPIMVINWDFERQEFFDLFIKLGTV